MHYTVEVTMRQNALKTGWAQSEEDTKLDAIAKAAYWCGYYRGRGADIAEVKIFKIVRDEAIPVELPALFDNLTRS